ncbi:unnamed protein product [Ectocarpus sp. 4 AP-2014]
MAPFSHVWFSWVALVAVGEASFGDRSWLYIDCLDTCVDKLCGIKYVREDQDLELKSSEVARRDRLRRRLDEHLTQLQTLQQQRKDEQQQRSGPATAAEKTGASGLRRRLEEGAGEASREGRAAAHRDHLHQWHPPAGSGGAAVDFGSGSGSGGDRAEEGSGALGGGAEWADGGRRALSAAQDATGEEGKAGAAGGSNASSATVVDRYVHNPPWHLRVMGWDCESECKHTCMNLHVESRLAAGGDIWQYYGKWPFRRVWGIQELFSSLFSAGNGLPHLYHLLLSPGQYNPPGNYMRFWLTVYPWVGMNTWLWSAVFHARDVPWTEAADYFFALSNIFFVVWVAFVRLAGPPKNRSHRLRKLVPTVGVSMTVYYLLHISYMSFFTFDYGYNMTVALLAGVAHTALWLRYQYLIRDRPYARRGAVVIILLNAAILLEVNDFPPLFRLLDAHAIWHFTTIPLMFHWYHFVIQDARHEVTLSTKET